MTSFWMTVPPAKSSLINGLRRYLSKPEQDRADRFALAEDRAAYTAAHALLRSRLASRVGGEPWSLDIEKDHLGKPHLRGAEQEACHFSLSHTRRQVACVLSDCPVGIDVEHMDRSVDEAVFDVLSPSERRYLEDLPKSLRARGFLEIWTMKEAALKAHGTGLATGLDRFSVSPDRRTLHPADGSGLPPAKAWAFHFEELGGSALCCVACLKGGAPDVRPAFSECTPAGLLKTASSGSA